MTTINTVLESGTKQLVAFQIPITAWLEDRIEVPVNFKMELPCIIVSRPPAIHLHLTDGEFEIVPTRTKTAAT